MHKRFVGVHWPRERTENVQPSKQAKKVKQRQIVALLFHIIRGRGVRSNPQEPVRV